MVFRAPEARSRLCRALEDLFGATIVTLLKVPLVLSGTELRSVCRIRFAVINWHLKDASRSRRGRTRVWFRLTFG